MKSWTDVMMKTLLLFTCLCGVSVAVTRRSHVCQDSRTQDCCWSWKTNTWQQCRPQCELGCKHGKCVGPDQCVCHPGYTGKTCNQDVNECAFRPCKYRCMNTVGSYKCYCLNGFMMMLNGTCRNAQTCATVNCQYGCAVMKGEVRCQCPSPGLRLAPDGRTCVDVDECVTGRATCPRFRKCVNTFGSYICRCHEGFELKHINGKYHCTDKKFISICYDKSGHKKCKCRPGVHVKGDDCKLVVKVTVEPARPIVSSTTISMTTVPMTTTSVKTTAQTTIVTESSTTAGSTTAPPPTAVTITTPVPTNTNIATAMPTTVAMTTTSTTTRVSTTTTTTIATTSMSTSAVTTTTEMPPATTAITVTTATASAPVSTSTAEMNSTTSAYTTTLDNHIHREHTPKPRGDVHIPRHDNNLFDWEFDVELGNTAEYRRDDPGAGVLTCSFDEGVCMWMTDTEGDLHWETRDDPAGGRYLAVPEATNKRSVRGARLTIPLGPPTKAWKGGDLCLAFRHHLHGHHIGSLQLFVRKGRSHSASIWTRTGGHGWRHTQITLWGRGLDDIVLKGERRRDRHGEIAVDDFTLHRGACRERNNNTQ